MMFLENLLNYIRKIDILLEILINMKEWQDIH